MKQDLIRLVKHSGIYGLGIVLSKAVGFLMIPVYTRLLSPGDYGTLELLDMIVFLSSGLAATGIYGAVFRFYAAYDSDKDRKEVVATALFYTAGACAVFAFGLIHWSPFVSRLILGQVSFAPFVRIVALTFFFGELTEVPLAYWRAQGRTILFVSLGLARTVLGASTLAFFLAGLKWGVRGALYANLLTCGIWGLGLSGITLAKLPWRIGTDKLKEMLRYGLPTVAWGLGAFVLTYSDRLFLRHFSTLSEVGIYALGYKLAVATALIVNWPFGMAWQWQQFEIAKREGAKAIFAKVASYLLMITTLVTLGVSVLARDLIRILAPATYAGAAHVVPLIATSYLLMCVQYVVTSGLYIQRVTSRLAVIGAVTAVSNLGLNYVLISRFHIMGAAVATTLSYALQLGLCWIASQQVFPIRYEYTRNAVLLGSAVLIYLLDIQFNLGLLTSICLDLSMLLLFPLLCYGLLDRAERSAVRHGSTAALFELRRLWTKGPERGIERIPTPL